MFPFYRPPVEVKNEVAISESTADIAILLAALEEYLQINPIQLDLQPYPTKPKKKVSRKLGLTARPRLTKLSLVEQAKLSYMAVATGKNVHQVCRDLISEALATHSLDKLKTK